LPHSSPAFSANVSKSGPATTSSTPREASSRGVVRGVGSDKDGVVLIVELTGDDVDSWNAKSAVAMDQNYRVRPGTLVVFGWGKGTAVRRVSQADVDREPYYWTPREN
jgi:hypothetical protein